MKRTLYIIAFALFSCNSENAPDCLKLEGETVIEQFDTAYFNKIRIEDDVTLRVKQGDIQEVLVETGENLLNAITVEVIDETLIVKNSTGCNLVRDYATITAIVTTPELLSIRNSSEFNVVGEGVLRFPSLSLISNTTGGIEDSRKSGDFTMTIECEEFNVAANGFSGFYIDGFTERAVLSFEDEVPRFEGKDLIINDLRVFQRSASKMVVNPQHRIRGVIRGTGDVISVNRPAVVDVEEFFTGRLIFED